jgi:hypothetical protein
LIDAVLREETGQVASKSSWRAPKSFLDDCELWFDITQNDADGDGLTWAIEVALGSDPTSIDGPTAACPLGDIDNDGLPNWYECKQDTNWPPSITAMAGNGDLDYDGLSNLEEYELRGLNTNPFYKDLFVEIDWLESNPLPTNKEFIYDMINYYSTILGGIHLVVEIDEEIPLIHTYSDISGTTQTLDLGDGTWVSEFEANIVENNYHQNEKTHVYCLIVGTIEVGYQDDNAYGGAGPDFGFMLASNYLESDFDNNIDAWKVTFAHELGHCIGMGLSKTEAFNSNTGLPGFMEIYCWDDFCFMSKSMSDTGNPSIQNYYCAECLSSSIVSDINFFFKDTGYDSSYDEYIILTARLFNKFSIENECNTSTYEQW